MKNWKIVKLGELLKESKVVSENPNTENRIRVKLNVLGVEKRPDMKDKKGATTYYTRKAGQFIYGKQNFHKGAFGVIPKDLDGFESSSDIPAFDVDGTCYPEWIFYFFKKANFYLKLRNLAKGIGSKRIQPSQIYSLNIFLPSKEDQKKILKEIEIAEADKTELIQQFTFQDEKLAELRMSIMRDAIKGDLTTEWRNQNQNNETSERLLDEIRTLKDKLINEGQIKKQRELPPIRNSELSYDIPRQWIWVRLQDITLLVTDGKHGNCRDELNSGYYFLSAKDIKDGVLNYEYAREINYEEFLEVHQRTDLKPGDLCIVNTGATVGKTAVVSDDPRSTRTTFQKSVAIVKVPKQFVSVLYLDLFVKAETANLLKKSGGSAINNLLLIDLKSLLIPLPNFDEQNEIVEKVSQLMIDCDRMETEILANKENAEHILQSVLIKLLGEENNVIIANNNMDLGYESTVRTKFYNKKTTDMDLVKLLKENGKLHAEDLWQMSKYQNDIDAFYAELKRLIENEKSIKECEEKGYIELI